MDQVKTGCSLVEGDEFALLGNMDQVKTRRSLVEGDEFASLGYHRTG
jgi:hypothetical protein